MMRVLHFHFGKDGGAERFFVHLVNALAERGLEQKVVIRPERSWRKELHPQIGVMESHFRTVSVDRILLPIRMERLIRQWQPRAVLGWMPKGAKLIPAVDGPLRLTRLGDYPDSLKKFRNVDILIGNTPGIIERARRLGWQKRTEVVSNFTDARRVDPLDREGLGVAKGRFVVSAMGRFVHRKGFDVLVRALAKVPDADLWLLGEGEEEPQLRALVAELGIGERVRFAGWQADPRPFVAASDCFVMPSRHEPLGNVILEAWAQHVPVIATRSEGPVWFMSDGTDGLLVDVDDPEGLAAAIESVRTDAELSGRLVRGGHSTLDTRFSKAAIVNAYMELMTTAR